MIGGSKAVGQGSKKGVLRAPKGPFRAKENDPEAANNQNTCMHFHNIRLLRHV